VFVCVNLCPNFDFVRSVTFEVRLTYNRSGREVRRIIMDDYEAYKQRMAALSGAIFLFGLAALFLADAIFPAILLLIWVCAIPALIAEQGWKFGLWILLQMGCWWRLRRRTVSTSSTKHGERNTSPGWRRVRAKPNASGSGRIYRCRQRMRTINRTTITITITLTARSAA
jgi:hypothetical protein